MNGDHRTVAWRGLVYPSLEFCQLRQLSGGWQLGGTVVAVIDERPLRATYSVECDTGWLTRRLTLTVEDASGERQLNLAVREDGRWLSAGQPLAHVDGLPDIDLGITPATNTLPIRRLNLAVGEQADVVATWVRFPSLTIEPLSQRYTRLSEHTYRYQSETGFESHLNVDADGIVTTYPAGWERVR